MIATIVRLVILLDPFAPSGSDGGNWLAFGHDLFGHHVRSTSISYPPLVPLVVLVAVWILGVTPGFTVVALACALAPGVAMYAVLRALGMGWKAALPAGFLVVAASTGEAVAWGGYPQLLGIGFMIGLLWALDKYLRSGGRRAAAAVGALAFALLATSHLLAAAAVVTIVVLVGLHLVVRPCGGDSPPTGRLAKTLALAMLPCLLLVPLYLHLGDTVLDSFMSRPAGDRLNLHQTLQALKALYGDLPDFWRNATILAIITPLLLLRRRTSSLWMLASALGISVALLVLLGREVRFLYLVPPAVVLGLACWIDELGRGDDRTLLRLGQVVSIVLVLALGLEAARGPQHFRAHRDFYRMLTPELTDGVEWLRGHTPSDAVVAVGAINGVPLGWWVEGLGQRHAILESDPRWLNFADERARADKAIDVFTDDFPSPVSFAGARAIGVGWILVPKTDAAFEQTRQRIEALKATDPAVVAFENRDTIILKVPA